MAGANHYPTYADLLRAYYDGLRNYTGDPDVAEDLGIPVTPGSFHEHVRAAGDAALALSRISAETHTEQNTH